MKHRFILRWLGRLGEVFFRLGLVLSLVLGGLLYPGAARPAAAFDIPSIPTPLVVTTVALTDDPQDGQCDLWEALKLTFDQKQNGTTQYHECNAAGAKVMGSTIIAFSPGLWGSTIQLPAPGPYPEFPFIIDDVTLLGPVTIDGGGKPADLHIFRLASGGKLTLIGLTLTNGYTSGSGGAILSTNYGEISLIGASIVGNTAESDGGAIDTNGDISITASNFSGNIASGVMPDGVTDASGVGYGGAISAYGTSKLSITASAFSGNVADKGGGAVYFSGKTMEVSNSTFSGNLVTDAITTTVSDALKGGGAIYLDPDSNLKVEKTAFNGNLSWVAPGGAINTALDTHTEISDSSFNANAAGDFTHDQMGGAIYNTEALTVTRSAFLLNVSTGSDGGALANDRGATAKLYNVTFAANMAPNGNGGAVWNGNTANNNLTTSVIARNVTFSDNQSSSSGAIFNSPSGDNVVTVGNTILNQGAGSANCNTAVTSEGHNIDSGISCSLAGPGDWLTTDPKLDGLGFNGGPIFSLLSMKLQPGSPALEAGDAAICQAEAVSNQDQRGEKRPQNGTGSGDGVCDIGAVENDGLNPGYGSIPVQPGPVDVGSATFGSSVSATFQVYDTGSLTLTLSAASISGADAAQFVITNTMPMELSPDGAKQLIYLACAPVGPAAGVRTAQLTLLTDDPDHASVVYDLLCNGTAAASPGFGSDPMAPGPFDFGQVVLNHSTPKTLHVLETGAADLELTGYSITGADPSDFLLATSLPLTAADGAGGLYLSVECNPQDYGMRTAVLTLQTNDPLHPAVGFNLVCEGVQPSPDYFDPLGQSLGGGGIPAMTNPYGAAISPDGKHVYVAAMSTDSVQVFRRDLATGALTFAQSLGDPDGDLDSAWMVTVGPDGKQVFVASYNAGTITVFDRDESTGFLTKTGRVKDGQSYGCLPFPCDGHVDALAGAYDMVISPDGKYLYSSSVLDDGLTVFGRYNDGSITTDLIGPYFVQTYTDTATLNGAYGLAISPDGQYLYATGYSSDTLVVFSRNSRYGTITPVATYSASADGIAGLNGVFRVTISPDGLYLYTGSWNSSSVTAFRRNPLDGTLTHLATYTDGVDGLTTLSATTAVAVSPDGRYLFSTSYSDNAVNVFTRDPSNGLLTLSQAIVRDGGSGLPALAGARQVVVSPDGKSIVATGYTDNQVSTFGMVNPVPALNAIAPASVEAGSDDFTLTLYGENFLPGVVVDWDGTNLPTTRLSATELNVQISAAQVAAVGSAVIHVTNPEPGGGASNPQVFTIIALGGNPVPSVTGMSPQGAPAGGGSFTLSVFGSGFTPHSVVQWNGEDRSTTYVDETTLQITISPQDFAQPGGAGVRVVNPSVVVQSVDEANGVGNLSRAVRFESTAPGVTPPPGVDHLSVDWVYTRGGLTHPVSLMVYGSNFTEDSVALWNGSPMSTEFVSGGQLLVTLNGEQLALPGTGKISVSTHTLQGGGQSNSLPLKVIWMYVVYLPVLVR